MGGQNNEAGTTVRRNLGATMNQGLEFLGIALVLNRRTFAWDTTGLPAGTYDLTARLDDGADIDGPDGDADYIEVPVMSVVLP